jgi:hypothetical protein
VLVIEVRAHDKCVTAQGVCDTGEAALSGCGCCRETVVTAGAAAVTGVKRKQPAWATGMRGARACALYCCTGNAKRLQII